ncbi:large ribosomal subunit protein eL20z-like isoform X1 [Phragmites australis]|uniref:large ribosomal subunit protein eL20z-like isoform X1 n=1 Tax=Phragmites australis TaxID=29695 RepID=UPI002D79DADC|nr:large ribosomal subunit protein eL20z-like isoform X1 [Phragmites australis]
MGGSQEPEAGGGKAGYSSSGLPPSSPPHLQDQPPQQYQHGYGTFQSPQAGSGESRQPPVGFPQPAPPPGFGGGGGYHQQLPYAPAEPYYAQGYQAVQGYDPVVEGRPVRMRRLPCCGLGLGWFLFITGFFLAAIPWYIGAFVLICVRVHEHREKPGYVACTIAAAIAAVAILLGVTKGTHVW